MKLKTLSSKLTFFRKDITRFAPLWALYLIGMMLVFFEAGASQYYDIFAYAVIPDLVGYFGVINLAYAGLCAMLLFGDLFQTRMCYSLHALPQRRERLFFSHLGAGLCFSMIPNLVACAYLMVRLQDYWFLALLWLLASEIQFLFFFGLAALSVMLTGNRLGMLAVYAVLNFFSLLAYWTVNTIYLPQMKGVILSEEIFTLLCPVVHLFNFKFFTFKSVPIDRKAADFFEYTGLGTGWDYLAAMAVIGVVILALAVVLYRRRNLESAGDFVAFRKLSPVVCVLLTLCVALVFAMFGDLTGSGYTTWLFVGLVIGYFGSLMLLERRLKVFRVKTFAGLAVLAAVMVGSFFMVENDVFNAVRWLPETDQVSSVTVANYNYNASTGYYEDYYNSNRIAVTLTEQSDITQIINAHEDILNRLDSDPNTAHRVVLTYKLKDGRTVKRSYSAPADGVNYSIISAYFYTPENIFGYTDWDTYVNSIQYIAVEGFHIPQALQQTVLEALKADCEKGYVSTLYAYKDCEYHVNIQVRYPDGTYVYRNLGVLSGAQETVALIKSPQVLLGYTDWADFLQNLTEVYVDGYQLRLDQQEGLMTALRSDCESGNIVDFYYEGAYEITYTYGGVKHWLCVPKTAANTLNWIQTNLQ